MADDDPPVDDSGGDVAPDEIPSDAESAPSETPPESTGREQTEVTPDEVPSDETSAPTPPETPPPIEEERKQLRQLLQGSRTRAYCKITVNGRDITNKLDPHLISVTVTDKTDDLDIASLELDDRDASLEIPPPKSPVRIELGWEQESLVTVFSGVIMELESGFGRKAGGRRMWIDCHGVDTSGPIKNQMQWSTGEGQPPGGQKGQEIPLGTAFGQVAGLVGMIGKVAPGVSNIIKRDYWAVAGESFMHWGHRIAQENGLFFKMGDGNKASLTSAKDDLNVDGKRMDAVLAEWGVNLILWRIKPFAARPSWAGAQVKWFDIAAGLWKQSDHKVPGGGPFNFQSAISGIPMGAPNAQVGDQQSGAQGAYGTAERSQGHVTINGEPRAKARGTCIIWGARPGVDARYSIVEAEHTYTRGGGYVTRLTLHRGEDFTVKPYWPGGPKPSDINKPNGTPTTTETPTTETPPPTTPEPTEAPDATTGEVPTEPPPPGGQVEIGDVEIIPNPE